MLKRINPSDANYGECLGESHTMLLEETVDAYFWSNVVALGLLGCLFIIIVYQHGIQARRDGRPPRCFGNLNSPLRGPTLRLRRLQKEIVH